MENDQNFTPIAASTLSFWQKYKNIFISVALLLVIAVSGWFVFSSFLKKDNTLSTQKLIVSDETAGWKTYRNEEYGYELKYPTEWDVSKGKENTSFKYGESDADDPLNEKNYFFMNVRVLKNANQKYVPIEKWVHALTQHFPNPPIDAAQTSIANMPAMILHVTEVGTWTHVYVSAGADVVEIAYPSTSEKEGIYNKIISTFKFIIPQSSIDTSNWKEVQNSDYKVKMSVPSQAKSGTTTCQLCKVGNNFYIENSDQKSPDYFKLVLSKESNFGLDDSWKEININLVGSNHTALVQKGEDYNRILITYGDFKIIGIASNKNGWQMLLKSLETFNQF